MDVTGISVSSSNLQAILILYSFKKEKNGLFITLLKNREKDSSVMHTFADSSFRVIFSEK